MKLRRSDTKGIDSRGRGPIAWMAGNSVAANIIMLVLLGGGIFTAIHIKQEVFPDFDLDMVQISVAYPGASPEEVEQGIVLVIEEAVRGLDGVKEVRSSALEGMGMVTVEMLLDADAQKLTQEIKQEVDRIRSFPEDAEKPDVVLMSRRRQVLSVILHGDVPEKALRSQAEALRDRLVQSPDITQVELDAVRPLEISIEVPHENLRRYGLTLEDVASRVRRASVELPGGEIKTEGGRVLLRMMERCDLGTEFARIPVVSTNEGAEVLLGEIATVVDGFEDTDRYATFNGRRAVLVDVYRVGDQSPIQVSDAVREILREVEAGLPPGLGLDIQNDSSDIYRQRMNLLLRNGALGLTLVFLLLGLFLEPRLAFWVTMGIPISFLGGMLLLPAMDVTINMISMFAFIIALGIVVDDAVVVGENVYEYRQRGMSFLQAAIRGAREVTLPVTFSILTNCVAFMPLFFVPGFMGKVFSLIPAVVIVVFLISLVESLFILPAHLGHQRERRWRFTAWIAALQARFSAWFSRMIRRVYGPFLEAALMYRYLTVAVAVAVLTLIVGYVASGRMGFTLFPRVESDYALATAVLPYGSPITASEAVQARLVKAAGEIVTEHGGARLSHGIFAEIGGSSAGGRGESGTSGGHVVKVRIYLSPPEERPVGTARVIQLWRKRVGAIPGLESISFRSDSGGPGSGAALNVELSHQDIQVLERAGEDLAASLARFPIVKDIDDGFSPGKEQLDFTVRPEGQSLGLQAMDVARQVRSAFYGAEALRQQRGRDEVKVMVRLPEAERTSEYNLENLLVRTPAGREIPVLEAVTVKRDRAYTAINRRNGRRTITVTADVSPPSRAGMILDQMEKTAYPALKKRYPGLDLSYVGRQQDMKESLQALGSGFVLALLVIFALLAIPFRSYVQPLIILVSIPFGMVGAVLGHLIMGYSLSVMSMMGLVALAGVVVNDSLVLINFANRRRDAGASPHDAVASAGVRRFRPIMLTSLTTFGGLAPMIFETSRQARFLIPMALSLGYGILFATLIALILVPALYLIVEDLRGLVCTRTSSPAGPGPAEAALDPVVRA